MIHSKAPSIFYCSRKYRSSLFIISQVIHFFEFCSRPNDVFIFAFLAVPRANSFVRILAHCHSRLCHAIQLNACLSPPLHIPHFPSITVSLTVLVTLSFTVSHLRPLLLLRPQPPSLTCWLLVLDVILT